MLDIAALLNAAPIGETRLNRRALSLVTSIIEGHASASHGPEGVGHLHTWAHAMGAFRFFDNDRLTLPALYAPCILGLGQLVLPGQRCFVVHDVSPLDYSRHQAKNDLVQVGNAGGFGYELFTSLVLDSGGRPLGPIMQEVRAEQGLLSSTTPLPLPFVDHMTQVERSVQVTDQHLPGREAVHLCDREFDDVLLLRFIQDAARKYIIRAQHMGRRVLFQGQRTILKQVAQQIVLLRAGDVERQGKQYELFIGEARVIFDRDSLRGVARKRHKPRPGNPLEVRLVISELRRPGHDPLRWVLLTNLDDPAHQIVQAYIYRWRVERFFYLNKVGLRLEQWRQETGERIGRRLALTQLAAMAIYQMQAAAGEDPEFGDVIKIVATLGGWLGRKQDPIGPIVLMRGIALVLGMVSALEEFGEAKLREVAARLTQALGLSPFPRRRSG